jgi:hypothetical protein
MKRPSGNSNPKVLSRYVVVVQDQARLRIHVLLYRSNCPPRHESGCVSDGERSGELAGRVSLDTAKFKVTGGSQVCSHDTL